MGSFPAWNGTPSGNVAVFSPDLTHRYLLTRYWSEAPPLAWIMLNPSTADGGLHDRDAHVWRLLARSHIRLHCLGLTTHGHPRHPLYLPSSAPVVPYDPPPAIRGTGGEETAR